MKTLKRNSRTLSCSPPRMLSPSMAHVNAACRKDLVSFVRKVFHVLNPSAIFYMNWHICSNRVCARTGTARKDQTR